MDRNRRRTIRTSGEKSWVDAVIMLEASLVCDTLGRMQTYATALHPLCIFRLTAFFFFFLSLFLTTSKPVFFLAL